MTTDPDLNLRDYFAAMAMLGFCARSGGYVGVEGAARNAYAIADEMLKVRQEPGRSPPNHMNSQEFSHADQS